MTPHRLNSPQLLLVAAILFAAAANAWAAAGARAALATSGPITQLPTALSLAFGDLRGSRIEMARRRAELRLIDFVELMWPVLEPEQPFVRTWVQEAICEHLQAITEGRLTKLLINVPPGFTKSMLVSVMWPAWEWGPRNRPDLRYMTWSYSAKLTEEHNEACRRLIESEVYQRFWGDRFDFDETTNAKAFYKNTKGGWRRSSSIEGAGTGFRADRLIWDDPHSVADGDSEAALRLATRWFARTLPTRVRNVDGSIAKVKVPFWVREAHGIGIEDDPDDGDRKATASATVGIMQRIHLHDISGIILKNPKLGYEHLIIEMRFKGDAHPARKSEHWKGSSIGYQDPRTDYGELADPVRYPLSEVDRLEAQMMLEGGSDAVAAQFDQWPLETSGSVFKVEWLPVIEAGAVPPALTIDIRGWDSAGGELKTAARTACVKSRRGTDKRFYLQHSKAVRGGPAVVDAFMRQMHADDEMLVDWSFPKDPGAASIHYSAYVVKEIAPGRCVRVSREDGSKQQRAKGLSGQAAIGNVAIVRHPGWEELRDELVDFPYGEFCDLVDAATRSFSEHIVQGNPSVIDGGFAG